MAYYPKSQIKENQFTPGGQLQIVSSQKEYIGYFWVTSKNEYFTGRNPQDIPSVPLQLIPVIPEPKVSLLTYSEGNDEYKNLKKANVTKALRLPYYQKPFPISEDYQRGRIQRYFAKKLNENLYIETNKEVYDKLFRKDVGYNYSLYLIFDLTWLISGKQSQVQTTNQEIVSLTERNYQIEGLKEYLNFNYLEFYNQTS